METATTLYRDMQITEENTEYDAAVKKLLADKIILAHILQNCALEFHSISIKEIAGRYIIGEPQVSKSAVMPDEANIAPKIQGVGVEDTTVTEGTVTFDIRFEVMVPGGGKVIQMIINVEAQNDFYPGYPLIKRSIYYCSRMISSQYGTVFTKSHYEKIKKVYSIWIFMNPPKARENTITKYSLTEENCVGTVREKPEYYDLITSVMICLGNPEDKKFDGLLKLLGTLLSSDIKAEDKQKVMEQDFGIQMTEKLERQVVEMCNLSKGVMEKGIEKGIEKGMIVSIESLMRKLKMTADQAMDALSIPENEQPKYKALIKR
ncbi:PD-(D/E)XK nuclease family transposase [Lachnospiraceae bacterium 45-W7]